MWGWFGGAAAQKRKEAPKNAILQLRQQLDMLQKREKHLENQMAEQEAIARKNAINNKNVAKAALRKKKLHERTMETTSAQILQLEQQIYSIEAANINQETYSAMKSANNAMKQIHGDLTMDKVDATMDEVREQHALAEEIAQAITNAPIGDALDEEELDAELDGLQQEAIDEKMMKTGTVPVGGEVSKLPSVNNGPIRTAQKQEDDEEEELRKLQAEMAM